MKTILNYDEFVNESLNKQDFYKGENYKVKVIKCDNKQAWYCDSIGKEFTVVDDNNPKQWEDGKERWKVVPQGDLHGVNYILKDDCSEPINESIHNYTSEQEDEFRNNMKDILTEEQIEDVLNNDKPVYAFSTQIEESLEELLESKLQDDYREFFKHVLDLYEVKSPASIKDEDCKKEFFNKIQKGWIKGEGLSEYGKKLMDCKCLDENGECCEDNEEE